VGSAGGGIVLLGLVAVGVWWCCRKRSVAKFLARGNTSAVAMHAQQQQA